MNLTAVAAFTAAALSLVNVVLSYRLTRRGHREQWRREEERPIVARILTISGEMMENWALLVATKERGARALDDELHAADAQAASEQLEAGYELNNKLRFEAAALDLLAGPQVSETAHKLFLAHLHIAHRFDDPNATETIYREGAKRVIELTELLIDQARADLGLGPSYQVPPSSLGGRLLGRDQGRRRPDGP